MGKTEIDKTKLMFQKHMEINQNNNSNDDDDDNNNNNNNNNNAIKTNRP